MTHVEASTRRIGAGLLALGLLMTLPGLTLAALGAPPSTVTICHGAGQVGTTQFVTLNLPYAAVYGNAGHFEENGTARAGHEDDYLGACLDLSSTTTVVAAPVPEVSTTTIVDSSTTTVESSTTTFPDSTTTTFADSTTTTVANSTTTTVEDSTTTTVADSTTTTSPDSSTTLILETSATTMADATTTTTGASTSTTEAETTSTRDEVEPNEVDDSQVSNGATSTEEDPDEVIAAVEELPFTGFDGPLAIPGLLMIALGMLAVVFGRAVDARRFRFGLHQGRHEADRR